MQFPDKKVILVTGSNGQLGQEFRNLAHQQDKYEFLFTTKETLDISNQAEIINIFKKFRPDYCINCAAYTKVDQAEIESDKAYLLNSEAIACLVNACKIYPTQMIHFSTDYIYDSVTDRPIVENDKCLPKSIYGKSKRAGELVLAQSNISWICLRVSWLYSSYGHNFVKTMLKLGAERDTVSVVYDQIGAPTYARDLANHVIEIIEKSSDNFPKSFFNYCNKGQTNWADFASEIFNLSAIDCVVKKISTSEYGAPAPRPAWSVLDQNRIERTYDFQIPGWQESLSACLKLIRAK